MEPSVVQSWLMAWVFTAPRILAAFAVLPILTDPLVPVTLRNGVLLILALFLLPVTHDQFLNMRHDMLWMFAIVAKEAVLGLMMGYVMSVPFWAIKAAGFMIDMQRGVMSALFFSQTTANMVSPLGNLFSLLLTTMLLVTGGFLTLLQTLFLSYQVWPIDQFMFHLNADVASFFLKQLDMLLYTTVLLAGPFMGLMFLVDLGLGLVGRYLPQLNIFLIAMPVKSALAFFILALYIGYIADYMRNSFVRIADALPLLSRLLQ